jgi:hypothetical protein
MVQQFFLDYHKKIIPVKSGVENLSTTACHTHRVNLEIKKTIYTNKRGREWWNFYLDKYVDVEEPETTAEEAITISKLLFLKTNL